MHEIRKSKNKNQVRLQLMKYEKLVNYIRNSKSLMRRKIKISKNGSEGYLSRTEVNSILLQAGVNKPTSQNGMTKLVLLVQKTERKRKIKENLNNIWKWLWKW